MSGTNLSELERRLLKLQDNNSTSTQSLQTRLQTLQGESLQTHTYASLQSRFSSIFGASDIPITSNISGTDLATEAYLSAAQGSGKDWYDDEEDAAWNGGGGGTHETSMATAALFGSNVGHADDDEISNLLAEAQDAVRMSSSVAGGYRDTRVDGNEDEDEDDEVAAIIQASKDEIHLHNKFGVKRCFHHERLPAINRRGITRSL